MSEMWRFGRGEGADVGLDETGGRVRLTVGEFTRVAQAGRPRMAYRAESR